MKFSKEHYFLCFLIVLVKNAAGLAVMSVDFGSEFMKIAIVKPGVPMEIVINKESRRKTPTIVTIKDEERLFGDASLSAGIRSPKSTYRYLLDVLAKHFDNPLVAQYQQKFPFYELVKDEQTGTVLFKHDESTFFSPEELIGMILQQAKEYAETFAEQPISEAVITVPPYFNQAERRAMLRAADLAGLKVLQLINDNTAVALNYGVFRRKIFNETAMNYMFFDIGASATSATVVAYQMVKTKSPVSGVVDTFPQLTIKGVGVDRTLGGMEFQLRLRDLLARQFNQQKKTKNDVTKDVRAMQKLYKEAGRLKQVLSANADHFAQVENLLDDEDFRAKVTREEFESLGQDLFDRIEKVVKDALASSEMTMDEISEVILMGGGTRIPKVQEALKSVIKREDLGKGINTDEAAALGAVYQAAHLGKGFKVKKFAIKDAVLYPITVEFERVRTKDDSSDLSRTVKRILFGRMQFYPQKKVMTFNKHVKDFTFEVNYGDLSFLTEAELQTFGNTTLEKVMLTGIEDAYSKHGTDSESKGVKAHFRMDDSGVLYLDKVESVFEKLVTKEAEAEESTLTKIGNTISNLFGGGKKEEVKEGNVEDEPKEDIPAEEADNKTDNTTIDGSEDEQQQQPPEDKTVKQEEEDEKASSEGSKSEKSDDKEETSDQAASDEKKSETTEESKSEAKETKPETESKEGKDKQEGEKEEQKEGRQEDSPSEKKEKKEEKPKLTTIRSDIKANVVVTDLQDPDDEKLKQSKKLLEDLKKRDEEKDLLEKAKNEIESFVFDAQDKLEQKSYKLCSTEDERVAIGEKLISTSDWLADQDDSTPRKDYEAKLKELKSATRALYRRVQEMQDRPGAIEALNSMVNHTSYFLTGMKNFTGEDQPFTQVEYDALEKLIIETKEWNKTVNAEQKKTPLTEKPKFTVEDVATKIAALDREMKYLINKVKTFRPKAKSKVKETTNKTESANKTETAGNDTKTTTKDKTKVSKEEAQLDRDILEEEATVESEDTVTPESSANADKSAHDPDDEL